MRSFASINQSFTMHANMEIKAFVCVCVLLSLGRLRCRFVVICVLARCLFYSLFVIQSPYFG